MSYYIAMVFVYNSDGGRVMDLFLSLFTGVIVTVMIMFNGQLSDYCGIYLSTAIIHFVGLMTFLCILKIKKIKIPFSNHFPFFLYTGGIIGVFTVIFNVFSVSHLGATLLTALGLLGQMLTSVLLEQRGWLGTPQSSMNAQKLLSLMIVMIGIGVMFL